jgi:hypothetical protein
MGPDPSTPTSGASDRRHPGASCSPGPICEQTPETTCDHGRVRRTRRIVERSGAPARPRASIGVAAGLVALLATLVLAGAAPSSTAASVQSAPVCLPDASAGQLDRLFAVEPGGVVGADYQRATALSDGRILWTFQDAEVRLPAGGTRLVHNIGMIQDQACFRVLMRGTANDPRPWLFADETVPFSRWYWPLGAELGADGRVHVFAAEMHERGPCYLSRTEPTATVVAIVDQGTLAVRSTARPANSSASLYGFSIESDSTWTYLFAQCHRQFGYDPYIFVYAHDFTCSGRVTVARVPKGQLLAAPTYWSGNGWRTDPASALPILDTTRLVNAAQFTYVNNQWMVITKVGDWWGDRIVVEQAVRPVGPYRVVADWAPATKCSADCNTYFASWIPSTSPDQLMYGLSHNRWDGIASEVYRPTFGIVAAPPQTMLPANRCSLGYCR